MFSKIKPYLNQVLDAAVIGSVGVIVGDLYAVLHPQANSVKLLTIAAGVVLGGLIVNKIFKN